MKASRGEKSKKMTSVAKIEANRRNAVKSTGPRSMAGRCRVRWNAVKDGILSKAVIINSGWGEERPADFARLLENLREDYRPCGTIEEMLVERIAISYWRLRRVLNAEVGEIQKRLSHGVVQERERRRKEFYEAIAVEITDGSIYGIMRFSSEGLRFLVDSMDAWRAEMETTQVLSAHTKHCVRRFLEGTPLCATLLSPQADLADWLQIIDTALTLHRSWLKEYDQQDFSREVALMQSFQIPDGRAAEKLGRYEAAIDRQLYRAIGELKSLQFARIYARHPIKLQNKATRTR